MENLRNCYAGIGSRKTPKDVCITMHKIAVELELIGWVLRSGGADGADTAFESGVKSELNKEIFLPWNGFNGSKSSLWGVDELASKMAVEIHPVGNRLRPKVLQLHARNVYQVLGRPIAENPSKFVICWCDPNDMGGTGTAVRLADKNQIPVYNLFGKDTKNFDIRTFIESIILFC